MAFFPDDSKTSFDLPTDPPLTLVVEGQAVQTDRPATPAPVVVTPTAGSSSELAVLPPMAHNKRTAQTCNIKIVRANFKSLYNQTDQIFHSQNCIHPGSLTKPPSLNLQSPYLKSLKKIAKMI